MNKIYLKTITYYEGSNILSFPQKIFDYPTNYTHHNVFYI